MQALIAIGSEPAPGLSHPEKHSLPFVDLVHSCLVLVRFFLNVYFYLRYIGPI